MDGHSARGLGRARHPLLGLATLDGELAYLSRSFAPILPIQLQTIYGDREEVYPGGGHGRHHSGEQTIPNTPASERSPNGVDDKVRRRHDIRHATVMAPRTHPS